MVFSKILTLFILCLSFGSKAELVKISTKQSIDRIRYLSDDGKFTFFQKRDGTLSLTFFFNVRDIIKLSPGTEYQVTANEDKSLFIILAKENFHQLNSIKNPWDIYVLRGGKGTPIKIGSGLGAKLQFDNTWISYYAPTEKKVYIHSLINKLLNFSFKVQSTNDPYFIPQVELVDNNNLIFTDRGRNGNISLFHFIKSENKFKKIYESKIAAGKVELCRHNNDFIIGEFTLFNAKTGARINRLKKENIYKDFKLSSIYRSSHPDLGNMICKGDDLFFIKAKRPDVDKFYKQTDLYQINLTNNKLKRLTFKNRINQFFRMDQSIIVNFRTELYTIKELAPKVKKKNEI